ncbi:MAG: lysylphosphatidylglycerol synthase transmembrane domain-containing protein [Endomicrobiia bacterium]
MKKWLKFIFGILISAILLYFVFKKVEISLVVKNLKETKLSYIFLCIILGFLLLFIRSYRWKIFISEYKFFDIFKFFESTSIGLFFNNILPFRMGDFVQAYVLSRKTQIQKSLTFSTVLMERFIDLFPPIIFIIIGSFFIILPKQISIFFSVVVLVLLIFGFFLLLKLKNFIINFLERASLKYRIFTKIKNILKNFYSAVENFKNFKLLIKVLFLTLLLWSGYSIGMFLVCKSLNIDLPSLWAGFLIQAITAVSVAIPSSPGYIGSWEFMAMLSLTIFKVEKTKALSFALLSHILGMFPVIILGIFFIMKEITVIKGIKEESFYEN